MLSMGRSTISMAIFNSYVKLPEGTLSIESTVSLSSLTNQQAIDWAPPCSSVNQYCHYVTNQHKLYI